MFLWRALDFFLLVVFCCSHLQKMLTGLCLLKKKNTRKTRFLGVCACVLGDLLPSVFPLGFLCCFLPFSVWLLKEWFVSFERAAVWKAGRYCGCTSVCPRLCRSDRARLFRQHHTCWVTLLHRDHNFMEHRKKKSREKQILVVLLVAIHHLSELYIKWNIIFNNSVLISLFN